MPAPVAPTGYDLVREIGSGGFGTVWLARAQTGIWRAVKIVASASSADREAFRRELSGITRFQNATLGQPTQLAILHVEADDAQGLLRYVMELADDASGTTAFDPSSYVPLTLKELRLRRGRLPVAEVARIGVHVARSLGGPLPPAWQLAIEGAAFGLGEPMSTAAKARLQPALALAQGWIAVRRIEAGTQGPVEAAHA